jgi:Holliday junction resolvasome RuvABC ATP-dependent DNA helicase subunit
MKTMTITKPFENVVGQESVKRKLNFYIEGFKQTSMIPHFMFIAERGSGKTMVATEVAKQLIVDGKPKPAKEINCSTIKNVTQFVEQVLLPFVHDRECTILFDEASELPQDLTMSLLTMLNPNDNNRNTFVFGDYTFDIDFRKHSWLFATTEPQKVFHALMSRCTRIDFEPYTTDNLMTIVQRNITKNSKVVFAEDGVKAQIPTVLRNNPREAQKMATDIVTYCARYKKKTFTLADWNSLQKELGIQPMGLNATEIKVLRFLAKNGTTGVRLQDVAAATGMTPSAIQRDVELFLLRSGLMYVNAGRKITNKGKEFLKKVEV